MKNRLVAAALVLTLPSVGCGDRARAPATPALSDGLAAALGASVRPEWEKAPLRQYDFWLGEWEANWRSRVPGELHNAETSSRARHWLFPVLDGKAMVELARSLAPGASGNFTQGFSLRYWDPGKERWVMAQNWPAPDSSTGFADQLQGFERHGRIELFSGYVGGEGVRWIRRYTFSDVAPHRLRWDSARSRDGGETWIAGSIAEFDRTAAAVALPAIDEPFPDSPDGSHCTLETFHRFDSVRGAWAGTATDREGVGRPATLVGVPMQNGCSMLTVLTLKGEVPPYRLLQALTWAPREKAWVALHLDNQPGSAHQFRVGREDGAGRPVLGRNTEQVIQGDVVPISAAEVVPGDPTDRTVWHEIDENRVRFELQERGNGAWVPVLAVTLDRAEPR